MQSSKKFTIRLLPMLFCIVATLLAACGDGAEQSTTNTAKASADKQILVSPLSGYSDIKTFDPGLSSDIPSINAIDMVFTGLVELDDKLQLHNQLAESYSVASDGTTWTFKLKLNLKFSDGTPLTSTDVIYSIDRALQPALKSPTGPYYLALIKDSDKLNAGKIKTIIGDSLLAPDAQTVIIKASKKAAYFLETLTYSCSYVVEKSMIDKYGNNFADHLSEGIGGDGPWKVARYVHGQEIDFVPNPNYYGPKPQLKKWILAFYKTDDTTYKAYQNNQVDSAPVPTPQLPEAKALPDKQFHSIPLLATYYYSMNYLVKPFDNIKVRQAFALAINKDELAHNIFKDTVQATNHIVPPGLPGYGNDPIGPAGVTKTSGDQQMAKQLFQQGLQEEGLTPATLPQLTFSVSSDGSVDARNEFAAVQQMWQNTLGVNVKVNDIDYNTLLNDISAVTNNPKGLQLWFTDWYEDYPDAQDWLTLQFDNGSPDNNMNYGQNKASDASVQQQMQQLLEQADTNPDQVSRLQQYKKAEQQLINDVAWIPIYQPLYTYVQKACVVGSVDNQQELTPPDDWGAIYISTASSCANTSQYK